MSDMTDVTAAAQRAATMQFADVEIVGYSLQDDGSHNVELNVAGLKEGAQSSETNTPETEGGETGSDDGDTHDEQSDDTPEDRGPTTWDVAGRDLGYNDLQTAAKEHLDSYPEDTSGDGLAEALNQAADTANEPDNTENDTQDESDDSNTPASGGVEKVEEDGRTKWVVNGKKRTYNDLQKAVRGMDMAWPDDQTGDNLAEIVADGGETATKTESDDDDDDDTPTSETENDGEIPMSEAKLLDEGVDKANIAAVQKYQGKNGVCDHEDCVYGANKDANYCAKHQDDSPSGSNDGGSKDITKSYEDLTEGQKAAAQDLLKSNEDMSLEEAVQMV